MKMKKVLNKAVAGIIEEGNDSGVKELKVFFKENVWPKSATKKEVYKSLDMYITGQLKRKPEEKLLDTLLFIDKKIPKLSNKQIKMLKNLKEIVKSAREEECEHNLKVSAFVHGGGFCPPSPMLEVICDKCGLNVTIPQGKKPKHGPSSIGVKILKKDMKLLSKWMKEQFDRRTIHLAEEISKDPFKALEKSPVWTHKLPLKIVDLELFESKSGE